MGKIRFSIELFFHFNLVYKIRDMIKEVKIWADIHSTGLFDMSGKQILREETTINLDTWEQLKKWVEKYDDVALMEVEERSNNNGLIKKLDNEGFMLLKKIEKEWPLDKSSNSIKVRYYSEGLLRYLNIDR